MRLYVRSAGLMVPWPYVVGERVQVRLQGCLPQLFLRRWSNSALTPLFLISAPLSGHTASQIWFVTAVPTAECWHALTVNSLVHRSGCHLCQV